MSIWITLTSDEEQKLGELARARGKDLSTFAGEVMTAYLNIANPNVPSTFEEILAPIWEGWAASRMTDVELDDLFEQELRRVRNERRHSAERP